MYGRGQQNNNICKFYQQGRCKFGDACKYSHGDNNNRQQPHQNSYAALSNQGNSSNARPQPARANGNANTNPYRAPYSEPSQATPYSVTREGIETDLKKERPQWPFSAYGPGRDAPKQLFEGPLEQSFEEMRVAFYLAQAEGNAQAAIQNEQELLQKSNAQVQQVLNDLGGAVQYVVAGKNEPNNRLDQARNPPGSSAPTAPTSAFGQPSGVAAGAAPSAFGASSFTKPAVPAFGAPTQPSAFGQPSVPAQGGAFGQPSALGGGSAFGKPAFGQAAFGQPSAPAQTGGFGQPSMSGQSGGFGQPSAPAQGGGFGQPSALAQGGGFGQPSALGQSGGFGQPSSSGQTGGFGQPSTLGQTGGFGNQSAPAQASAFGQPAFGAASNPGQSANPFGQAAANGGTQSSPFATAASTQQTNGQAANPFGQPTNSANQGTAFGQASTFGTARPQSAFGKPTSPAPAGGFGQASAPASSSPFGQPSAPAQSTSWGQPAASTQLSPNPFNQASAPAQTNPFGQNSEAPGFGQAGQPANASSSSQPNAPLQINGAAGGPLVSPNPSTYTTRNPDNSLRSWKNAPVQYIDGKARARQNNGTFQLIFHPNGPPPPVPGLEERPEAYNATLDAAYAFVREHGVFKDGIIPDVPPKREWIRYDV